MDAVPADLVVHPNENPSLILVQPLLDEHNYHSWKISMTTALSSKNKMGIVDGTIAPMAPTDAHYSYWRQCNSMVKAWLVNAVSRNIAQSIASFKTAKDMWDDLEDRYGGGDLYTLSNIMEEIQNTKQGNLSVSQYFTQLKILWDQLVTLSIPPDCDCGKKWFQSYLEKQHVIRFLKGLNDEFASIKSQILMLDPLPSVKTVFAMAVKQEKQQLYCFGPRLVDSTAAYSHTNDESSNVMAAQGYSRPSYNTGNIKKPICSHCGFTGHTVDRCYKKHGFPPNWKGKTKNQHSAHCVGMEDLTNSVQDNSYDGQQDPSIHVIQEQYQQILHLLQGNQGGHAPSPKVNSVALNANFGPPETSGHGQFEEDWLS